MKLLNKYKKIITFICLLAIISIISLNLTTISYAASEWIPRNFTLKIDNVYDSSTGWGPYSGTFTFTIGLTDDYVLIRTETGEFKYAKLSGSSLSWSWVYPNGSSQNATCISYESDTVSTSDTKYTLNQHIIRTFTKYATLISSDVPVFTSEDSALAYLKNGIADKDTCLNYDECFTLPTPFNIDIYNSSENLYKFYIKFEQNLEKLSNCILKYKEEYYIDSSKIDEDTTDTTEYILIDILNPTTLEFDYSELLNNTTITTDDEYFLLTVKMQNVSNDGKYTSNEVTCEIRVNKNGFMQRKNGHDDQVDIDITHNIFKPLLNNNGEENEHYQPPVIGDILGGSGGDFVGSIANGFGVLGENGIFSLISSMFSFIPSDIWNMIYIGIGAFITIALWKLIIH